MAHPGPSSTKSSGYRARHRTWGIAAALAVLTLVLYWPCLHYPTTVYDDPDVVSAHPQVVAGLSVQGVRWAFTTRHYGNWNPLNWLSLEFDSTLFGNHRSVGFHLTNVLVHLSSVLLLFRFLIQATKRVWRSAAVAALFAFHPIHVEPVVWVAERSGILGGFFWMLALNLYGSYVRRPGLGRFLLVALALVLGLMAKPMLLPLPFVFLLLDFWPLQRGSRAKPPVRRVGFLLDKLPLCGLVLGWTYLAYVAQQQIGAVPSLERFPINVRMGNALLSYAAYLGKLLWPMNLAAYYPHSGATLSEWRVLAAALLLAMLTLLMLRRARAQPYLAVGWLWYLGALVPVIGLVQIGWLGMADRYVYVPAIGVYLILVWGSVDLARAYSLPRWFVTAAWCLALAACAIRSHFQIDHWKSYRDVWEHTLAVTQNNAMAHNQLGTFFSRQQMYPRAAKEFEEAAALDPQQALFHYNLATSLRELGREEEAIKACRRALDLAPQSAVFHFTLGNLLRDLGHTEEALAELRAAIELDNSQPSFHNSLGNLLRDLNRPEEATQAFQEAIALDPNYSSAHVGLGNLLAELGRYEEAANEYRRAVTLNPQVAVGYLNLGMALQMQGRLEEAAAEYRKALELGANQAVGRLQTCREFLMLRPRLDALLEGREQPADNAERFVFAELCRQPFEGKYALAVRLYTEAFRAEPALVDDPRNRRRYFAAQAAVLAANLDPKEGTRLRRQGLDWLRADLAIWTERVHFPGARAQALVKQTLRGWLRDPVFASVREPTALARLPESERQAWRKLWQDVESLLRN